MTNNQMKQYQIKYGERRDGMETPEEELNRGWLELQDPLMQGAYHTVKAVIIEKEEGNPEAYFELLNLLRDFSVRRRDVLEGESNARN